MYVCMYVSTTMLSTWIAHFDVIYVHTEYVVEDVSVRIVGVFAFSDVSAQEVNQLTKVIWESDVSVSSQRDVFPRVNTGLIANQPVGRDVTVGQPQRIAVRAHIYVRELQPEHKIHYTSAGGENVISLDRESNVCEVNYDEG